MKKKILILFLIFTYILVFGITKVNAADPVVKIGTKTYNSLSSAINAVPNNTKTTITVLRDFSEHVTISNTKDIVLDLQGYTLSNKTEKTVISNNGKLEIANGTITSDGTSGMINNNKDAVFVMNSGSLIATGTRQALYNDGGTVTISGSASLESATEERATLHNKNSGTITIEGGEVIANNSYAIYNEKGTLNIGTKNDIYNKNVPVIQGATYGIVANTKYNVYDGIIRGVTYHVGTATTGNAPTVADDVGETKVEDYEEDSQKELSEVEIDGVTYKSFTYELDNTNRIKIMFDPNGGEVSKSHKWMYIGNPIGSLPTPTRVDYSFDGWFTAATGGDQITEDSTPDHDETYYAHWTYVDPNTVAWVEGIGYKSLSDAFDIGGIVRLEKDVIITDHLEMSKITTLDLNGHTITLRNRSIIVSNKVTITDSSENQSGKITSDAYFTIIVGKEDVETDGYLIVKGGTIEGLGAHGAIYNYETVEIDGGTIQSTVTTDNGYTVYNCKNLIMKSGTVYSTNQRAIQVYKNATFTMDGGLVKADSTGEQVVNLYGDCSATINGGTIEGLEYETAGIAMFHNTELIVNGGTIKGNSMAIAGNGNDASTHANITINGGNMIATNGVGLYLPQKDSTTIINGGNIEGLTGIEIRASNLIVNGGTITGTSDTYEATNNPSGTTTKGAAIAVSQHISEQPIVVAINGGSLKSVIPLWEVNPMNNPPEALEKITIEVVQGEFIATNESVDAPDMDPFISGGIYTTDPSAYVIEGYDVIPAPEGYEVVEGHQVLISDEDKDYVSVDKKYIGRGKEVTLNVKNKLYYETIIELRDTNGNKIELLGSKFTMPDSDVTVKVSYRKILNPETGDNIYINVLLLLISITGLIVIIKKAIKA